MAIWRSILRWAGANDAPNPGVEYAHDAPFSLARNRKTCSMLICSSPTLSQGKRGEARGTAATERVHTAHFCLQRL